LRKLGAFWLSDSGERPTPGPAPRPFRDPAPTDVFVTRLHVRYDATRFPDDLAFQETADRANFQGRYILRHPWKGDDRCEAATSSLSASAFERGSRRSEAIGKHPGRCALAAGCERRR